MLKFLYTCFTNPLGLPIDPFWEYIILLAVGELVHEIAYWISSGGKFGAVVYWVTKLIAFLAIWAILSSIIHAINFVILHWIWFTIGGSLLLVGIVVWIVVVYRLKNRNAPQQDKKE